VEQSTTSPLLEARSLSKHFAGITAVDDVSFRVRAGEVLCLLGDNGAGKSTLIKMLAGVHRPTAGQILINGNPVILASPREAKALGIATVQQDVGTIALMSIARNFFLGSELTRGHGPFKRIDHKRANAIVMEQVAKLGIRRVQSGDQLCGVMSGGERQALAIARAIYFGGRVLILDEPTSALGVKQAEIVLRHIRQARRQGVAVILITHNVHHAIAVGDHFVVLVHGKVAADFRRGEKTREEILDLMSGGERLADFGDAEEGAES
jgi:simple sugar transport system ATP-binding protein